MAVRDVVVVGASAGGVEALQRFVAGLPANLPAAVLVVLHVPAHGSSALPAILTRRGALPAAHAVDGEPLAPGRIYIAPPDHHLLVRDGRLVLARGPRENGHRPAIDVTFRSAARHLGQRVVAVVLSGALDDGSAGAVTVKSRGGLALVQDPEDAIYPSMPSHVLRVVQPDAIAPASALAELVARHVGQPVEEPLAPGPALVAEETAMAELDLEALRDPARLSRSSGLTCPDCDGVLFEAEDDLVRYRCRVGHAWGTASLLAEQDAALERALWTALRALEEKVALARDLSMSARERGSTVTAKRYDDMAGDGIGATKVLRRLLLDQPARVRPDEV